MSSPADSSASGRLNSRARAARACAAVMRGASLDTALPEALHDSPARDHGFIRALCYGVLRDHRLLSHLAGQLLDRPLHRKQAQTMQLILVGLFQLRSMRVAPHAAVAETVSACGGLGEPRARGLVNAVLRRYQREAETLEANLPDDPAILYSHPDWMVQQLRQDWPDDWPAILAANQQPAPMVLRVNRRRHSRDEYLRLLAGAGIDAAAIQEVDGAIELREAVDVADLPGFAQGSVSVQDAAAQLAAPLLLDAPGMPGKTPARKNLRVLDACAAPGGKTAHLLETCPDLELTAVDVDGERLARVGDTLQRLGLHGGPVTLRTADAADTQAWWDGRPFDRILLDAPCSGSGVIRRHPDIKWLRRGADTGRLADQQLHLLTALWPLLAPGGSLLFATCSIFKAEGAQVIDSFLEEAESARSTPLDVAWGVASGAGRAILPAPMDGFFYALLGKHGN